MFPFEREILSLREDEKRIIILRGRPIVIRLATDDDFDTAVVYEPVEQPRGEGPR